MNGILTNMSIKQPEKVAYLLLIKKGQSRVLISNRKEKYLAYLLCIMFACSKKWDMLKLNPKQKW